MLLMQQFQATLHRLSGRGDQQEGDPCLASAQDGETALATGGAEKFPFGGWGI